MLTRPAASKLPTGRGVRVAVIDSGVHPAHPHIGSISGGTSIIAASDDILDRLGHGTAVMAAIKEKAPEAELFAVKIFDRALKTSIDTLTGALEWCLEHEMH